MLVAHRRTDDPDVITIERTRLGGLTARTVREVVAQERRLLRSPNPVLHSTARMATRAIRVIERLDPDVIMLHWLGSRTLSVAQIGRLAAQRRPIAWVLHDTWAFCGAEHYPHGEGDRRFTDGYHRENRPPEERGIDLNRQTWDRKRRHWTSPMQLVAPSRWMAEQVRASALMGDWPVAVIPNPLDVDWWGAIPRTEARQRLGIEPDRRIILFGAFGGERDPRKGADLLRSALPRVVLRLTDMGREPLELVTFGGSLGTGRFGDLPVRSIGRLDDEALRLHYSAADVMVVPSRQDNLPQTAVESIACGTPVVGFRVGGLPDIVEERVTGRLVEPFSPLALAEGITWVLEDAHRSARLSVAARTSSSRWVPSSIAAAYARLLASASAPRPCPNTSMTSERHE
jgi:glycosyltransferase involved in cell wall biosynthesis